MPGKTLRLKTLPFLFLLFALGACSGMMMDVEDMPGSDASIVLMKGSSVNVATPTLTADVTAALDKAEYPRDKFTGLVQSSMVSALQSKGVNASASDAPGEATLSIQITDFGKGSGAARMFAGGLAGDSDLDGTAVLQTKAGKRQLEIEKDGSQSGTTEAGDQTSENVGYFTTALANKICQ